MRNICVQMDEQAESENFRSLSQKWNYFSPSIHSLWIFLVMENECRDEDKKRKYFIAYLPCLLSVPCADASE